jgi:cytochrome c oxidase subunit 3
MLAVLSFGIGLPLVLLSIGGWIREAVEETEWHLSISAMPFFIISEAFVFVAFFAAYWATRLTAPAWPPAGTPEHMPLLMPLIMTIVLVCSSGTVYMAETRLDRGDRDGFVKWLVITIILGVAFLSMSAYEWNHLFKEGFDFKTNIYSTSFYSITGFHASHVFVGVCIFLAVLIKALLGKISESMVKSGGIYWHFVVVISLFVLSQVYFW